jgi:hypothetical protein
MMTMEWTSRYYFNVIVFAGAMEKFVFWIEWCVKKYRGDRLLLWRLMACFGDEKCLGDPWLSLESGDFKLFLWRSVCHVLLWPLVTLLSGYPLRDSKSSGT